jgi:ribosome-associated protein
MTSEPRQDPTTRALHLTDRPKPAPVGTEREQAVRAFIIDTARLLKDLHCENILVFDVHGLSDLTDYILIATGTSDRQIKGVAGQINDLAEEQGLERFGSERDSDSTWLVLDYVDTIIHLFEPIARAHYDLEMLWGDAPKIDWRRTDDPKETEKG